MKKVTLAKFNGTLLAKMLPALSAGQRTLVDQRTHVDLRPLPAIGTSLVAAAAPAAVDSTSQSQLRGLR